MNLYKLAQKLRARATLIEKRAALVAQPAQARALSLDAAFLRRIAHRCDPRLRRRRGRQSPEDG